MVDHIEQFRRPGVKPVTPQSRKEDVAWYQSPRWRKLRRLILHRDPVCTECKTAVSQHVHHVKPRKQFPELAYDASNLRGVCIPCHLKMPER